MPLLVGDITSAAKHRKGGTHAGRAPADMGKAADGVADGLANAGPPCSAPHAGALLTCLLSSSSSNPVATTLIACACWTMQWQAVAVYLHVSLSAQVLMYDD